jgi:CRAL/TRIO domain
MKDVLSFLGFHHPPTFQTEVLLIHCIIQQANQSMEGTDAFNWRGAHYPGLNNGSIEQPAFQGRGACRGEEGGQNIALNGFQSLPALDREGPGYRLEISDDYRQKARRFRDVVAQTAELDPMSDFWCTQWALTTDDDTEEFVERALQLQQYREEYGIVDTHAFARRCIREFLDTFPGFIIAYNYIPAGHYVVIVDHAKLDIQALKRSPLIYHRGAYFMNHLHFIDLESIRKGGILMFECEGYDWSKHVDFDTFRNTWTELGSVYPLKVHRLLFFHPGVFMNLLVSMSKKFIPSRIRDRFQMGCQFGDWRLDQLYNMPNFEAAQQRLWFRIEDALRKRYSNDLLFSLD